MGSALVVSVIPEELMMPNFLRIRRNGVTRRLLDVYNEDHHSDDRCYCTTGELLELYPDAYFVLTFRPEKDLWHLPAHETQQGWWEDKDEVARYSQEDVGGSLKDFLNKKLSELRHMIRMPGRWLLGSVQVTDDECEPAGDDVGYFRFDKC